MFKNVLITRSVLMLFMKMTFVAKIITLLIKKTPEILNLEYKIIKIAFFVIRC